MSRNILKDATPLRYATCRPGPRKPYAVARPTVVGPEELWESRVTNLPYFASGRTDRKNRPDSRVLVSEDREAGRGGGEEVQVRRYLRRIDAPKLPRTRRSTLVAHGCDQDAGSLMRRRPTDRS